MTEASPGLVIAIISVTLLLLYFVVRSATYSAIEKSRLGERKYRMKSRAGGLYLDNLGRINEGLGILSPRSDNEKDRLLELKRLNEDLAMSEEDPEWVVAELEKINGEVRGHSTGR